MWLKLVPLCKFEVEIHFLKISFMEHNTQRRCSTEKNLLNVPLFTSLQGFWLVNREKKEQVIGSKNKSAKWVTSK